MLDKFYRNAMNRWREKHPGVPFSAGFFNPVIVQAYEDYISSPNRIQTIKNAFADANIFPMIVRTPGVYSDTDIARAKLCSLYIADELEAAKLKKIINSIPDIDNNINNTTVSFNQIPNTAINVDNVSLNGDIEHYKFTVRTAALDIINRNLVTPAQQLHAVLQEMKSNKACRVPNTTASAIKISSKNPVFPTGCCTTDELLLDLHAQREAKEKKVIEDRIKSLSLDSKKLTDTHKNEQIYNNFLASFDTSTDPEQWKSAKADILRIVYKALVGAGVSNCKKKEDLINAISPKLNERKASRNTILIPPKESSLIQDDNLNTECDDDIDDIDL